MTQCSIVGQKGEDAKKQNKTAAKIRKTTFASVSNFSSTHSATVRTIVWHNVVVTPESQTNLWSAASICFQCATALKHFATFKCVYAPKCESNEVESNCPQGHAEVWMNKKAAAVCKVAKFGPGTSGNGLFRRGISFLGRLRETIDSLVRWDFRDFGKNMFESSSRCCVGWFYGAFFCCRTETIVRSIAITARRVIVWHQMGTPWSTFDPHLALHMEVKNHYKKKETQLFFQAHP